MADVCREDNRYIKCGNCECKYINNHENIKHDFGYIRFKTCSKCRDKKNAYTQETSKMDIAWENCGSSVAKHIIAAHKRQHRCQPHTVCPKPSYKEWLLNKKYDTLLWEHKKDYKQFKEELILM